MAEEQKTAADLPPYSFAFPKEKSESDASSKRRSTKKIVIIAITCVLIAAIILAAILVGMYLFQQSQKDILKFTLDLNKDTKQETISDPNSNVVQYHVQKTDYDLLVIEDFNRDIQTFKVQENDQTRCFTTPLNRTATVTPDVIKELSANDDNKNDGNISDYMPTPLAMAYPPTGSFRTVTATQLCKVRLEEAEEPTARDHGAAEEVSWGLAAENGALLHTYAKQAAIRSESSVQNKDLI